MHAVYKHGTQSLRSLAKDIEVNCLVGHPKGHHPDFEITQTNEVNFSYLMETV